MLFWEVLTYKTCKAFHWYGFQTAEVIKIGDKGFFFEKDFSVMSS